ncbi:Hypp8811 [Branchiostoma lanceolatum]|uniref:Hypp8811 protein n=1 Tax=Branchiostoma lanceolatum TaxID=7740 RepID=A0A8K0EGN1_BRALA|nr:Hypp8811 [Branchiostoma lanceolatum]
MCTGYNVNRAYFLGVALLFLGIFSILLGVIGLGACHGYCVPLVAHVGAPIWSGIVVLLAGLCAIRSAYDPADGCRVTAFLVFVLLAFLATVVTVLVGLVELGTHPDIYYEEAFETHTKLIPITGPAVGGEAAAAEVTTGAPTTTGFPFTPIQLDEEIAVTVQDLFADGEAAPSATTTELPFTPIDFEEEIAVTAPLTFDDGGRRRRQEDAKSEPETSTDTSFMRVVYKDWPYYDNYVAIIVLVLLSAIIEVILTAILSCISCAAVCSGYHGYEAPAIVIYDGVRVTKLEGGQRAVQQSAGNIGIEEVKKEEV